MQPFQRADRACPLVHGKRKRAAFGLLMLALVGTLFLAWPSSRAQLLLDGHDDIVLDGLPGKASVSAATSTALNSNPNPSVAGDPVTFTATVTGKKSAPTGRVSLLDGAAPVPGCADLALAAVDALTSKASCTTAALGTGGHAIVAAYSGNGGFNSSSSGPLSQTVDKKNSSLALATSAGSTAVGQPVTFTATVSGYQPAGTISFKASHAASLATADGNCDAVPLGGGADIRTANCRTSALAAGSYTISATYPGDANNAGSSDSLAQVITGNAAPLIKFAGTSDRNGVPHAPLNLRVSASAADANATLAVSFAINGAQIAAAPLGGGEFGATWTPAAEGTYAVTAQAIVNGNPSLSASTSQTLIILASQAPNGILPDTTYSTPSFGATPGSLTVTDSGAASYSIPIQVPPGTAGMQPALALNYSSQGGYGPLGVGWSLSGLSAITRCPGTYAQDAARTGVNYDMNPDNDHYCLDGVRLVEVARRTVAGLPDQNFNKVEIEFRTEIESYSRIVGYAQQDPAQTLPGPNRFRVWTKSGPIMDYGARWNIITNGWSQNPLQPPGYGRYNATKVWALDRVYDRSGNQMTIDYADPYNEACANDVCAASPILVPRVPVYPQTGAAPASTPQPTGAYPMAEYWPKSIKYYAAGIAEGSAGKYNEVRFTYAQPAGVSGQRMYDSGSGATMLSRFLTRIETFVNVVPPAGAQTPRVRRYELAYEASPGSGRQRLKSVQEVGADGTALPATLFNWSDTAKQFGAKTAVSGPQVYFTDGPDLPALDVRVADIDGDGRSDIVSYTTKAQGGGGNSGNIAAYTLHTWTVCFSAGTGLACDDRFTHIETNASDLTTWLLSDVDGDGRADLILTYVDGIRICRAGPAGWACPATRTAFDSLHVGNRTDPTLREFHGDVDGDGRIDYVYVQGDGRLAVCLNQETGIACATKSIQPVCDPGEDAGSCAMPTEAQWQNQIFAADLNGDGKLDLIYRQHGGDGANDVDLWRTCRSDFGPGRSNEFICHKGWAHGVNGPLHHITVMDFNGDGLADMATRRAGFGGMPETDHPWQVCLATGDGAFEYLDPNYQPGTPADAASAPRCRAWKGAATTSDQTYYGDFNGDGRTDLLYRDPATLHWNVCRSIGTDFVCEQWGDASNQETLVPHTNVIVGDFDGDGRSDLLVWQGKIKDPNGSDGTFVDGGWHWILSGRNGQGAASQFGDLLERITTGLAASTSISYAPLTDGTVYAKGADAGLPAKELAIQSPLYVVKQTRGDDGLGQGGSFNTDYFYEGLRGRTDGRGLYGFLTRRSRDSSGIVTETEYQRAEANEPYADVWAKVGRPKVVRKYAPPDNSGYPLSQPPSEAWLVNRVTTSWQVSQSRTCAGAPCPGMPVPREVVAGNVLQEGWDLNRAPLPRTNTSSRDYDAYGNPQTIVVTTDDGFAKTTQSSYFNDGSNWVLGRLLASTVTSHAPNQPDIVRSSGFAYQGYGIDCGGAAGYLCVEAIEPNRYRDGTFSWQQTTYQYDRFGNKTLATLTYEDLDANGAVIDRSRTAQTEYAADDPATGEYYGGRFPTRTVNALGQAELRRFDIRFGAPVWVADPNGVTVATALDGFGHKYLETVSDANGNRLAQTFTAAEACSRPGLAAPACQAGGIERYRVRTRLSGGAETRTYYDALQREVRTESKAFNPDAWAGASIQYDALGRKWRLTKPVANADADGSLSTTLHYDALGRIDQQTTAGADGRATITLTNYDGQTTSVTIGGTGIAGRSSSKTINSQGQTVSVTDANNGRTSYQYDAVGNLVNVTGPATPTAPGGISEGMTYDVRGRKTSQSNPDSGTWSYEYNGVGELLRQTDAKRQATRQFYDALGRMIERREYAGADNPGLPAFVTVWNYDRYADGAACSQGIGKLCETRAAAAIRGSLIGGALDLTPGDGNSPVRELVRYDGSGRALQSVMEIHEWDAGQVTVKGFQTLTTYDAHSRPDKLAYPSGLTLQHRYTGWSGQLDQLAEWSNGATGTVHWRAASRYADGQIQWMGVGNVATHKSYDGWGRLQAVDTANGVLQRARYSFDVLGNLRSRGDGAPLGQAAEALSYDALNRLTADAQGPTSYDAAGNIQSRSGVGGSYQYQPNTHRVTSAGGYTLHYDANGNVDQLGGSANKTLSYTPFNLPSRIVAEGGVLDYVYNGGHARVKETSRTTQGADNGYTYYAGGMEEHKRPDQVIEQRHYLNTAEGPVGIVTWRSNGVNDARYWHKDHLGSIVAITDGNGAVLQRYVYDAWGRRSPAMVNADPNEPYAEERGFTGHEHLLEAEVIHMNGRLYFARIGRMLQADPIIQTPENSQSYNRYSYVLNNPLAFTDPSGYSWWTKWRGAVVGLAVAVLAPYAMTAYAASAGTSTALVSATFLETQGVITYSLTGAGMVTTGAAAGFAAGGIQGGNIESAVYGAITGGISGGVGAYFGNSWTLGRVAAQTTTSAALAYVSGAD